MLEVGKQIVIEFLGNMKFVIVRHVEGGMGDVYKVVDTSFSFAFGVKMLKHNIDYLDFKNECEIWMTVAVHPACAKPAAYGLIEGFPAIACKWYPSSLAGQDSKSWKNHEILNLFDRLESFFDYSSNVHNVLHCDIKPHNILLDNDRNPYVTDFGISRLAQVNGNPTNPIVVAGTRNYMAPELQFGSIPSIKSELYSFGISMFEFLTGGHPYLIESKANNDKRIGRAFKLLHRKLGTSAASQLDFIRQCISLKSSDRPDSFIVGRRFTSSDHALPATDVNSAVTKAQFFRRESKFAEAEDVLHNAIRTFGENPVILNSLAALYLISRSRESAIELFEKATEIMLNLDGKLNNALYLDPIVNLSIQYRHLNRFDDAFELLDKAWQFEKQRSHEDFKYPAFGWMLLYKGDFIESFKYMHACFSNCSIQIFDMLCLVEILWITGKLYEHADMILSMENLNGHMDEAQMLCSEFVARYANRQTNQSLSSVAIRNILTQNANIETNVVPDGMRTPLPEDICLEASIVYAIDKNVTGGKHRDKISERVQFNNCEFTNK